MKHEYLAYVTVHLSFLTFNFYFLIMSKRTQQVGDEIQRILSEAIQYELSDPRVGFATVIGVEMSADLQHAKVRISVMGDEEQQRETMRGLEHAKGFLRRQVATELRHMRMVPDLRFQLDNSLAYSQHIDELLHEIKEDQQGAKDTEPSA